jgi:hypothetical protein
MHIERSTPRVTRPVNACRTAVVTVAVLACAALVGACGSSTSSSSSSAAHANLNTTGVAASIEQTLLEKRHLHSTVACPAAVPQEKGRTFECIATIRGTKPPHAVTKAPFVVTIQTDRGYITYVGK